MYRSTALRSIPCYTKPMTKRPEITPENYQAIYSHYAEDSTVGWINNSLHIVGQAIYRPEVVMDDATRKELELQFALGKGALVVSNHPSGFDTVVLPGAFRTTGIPELQKTGALVKDSLYHGPLRLLWEGTGSLPVFREQSYPDMDRAMFMKTVNALLGVVAGRLRAGKSIMMMPEGTRSAPEGRTHLRLGDIKAGVARMALLASDENTFILPVGIHYQENAEGKLSPWRPTVALGDPITHFEAAPTGVKKQIYAGMQDALDRAHRD